MESCPILTAALEYFEKAIQLQPDAMLPRGAEWLILTQRKPSLTNFRPRMWRRRWKKPPAKPSRSMKLLAMKLTMRWLCGISLFAWDVAGADAESRRSLQLNPNLAATHRMRAWVLDALHERDESFRELKQAITLDPMQYTTDLGEAYMARGQFDDAIAELRRRSETDQNNWFIHFDLLQLYWLKGMKKEAVEELERQSETIPLKRPLYAGPTAVADHRRLHNGCLTISKPMPFAKDIFHPSKWPATTLFSATSRTP